MKITPLKSVEISEKQETSPAKNLFVIGVLFFVFGFVTWLGSVLVPYLKITCQLTNTASYLVAFSFYISYLIFALPSALVLQKIGYKNGMVVGLLLISLGDFFVYSSCTIKNIFIVFVGSIYSG